MNEMRDKVKTGIDAAADQSKGLADRAAGVADRASNVLDQVKHKAEDAADKANAYAHEAKDKVEHWAEDACDVAGDKLGTLGNDVTSMVRKYPIQALLVGLGVGLLLGRVSRA